MFYFDANASARPHPSVGSWVQKYLDAGPANPSSAHKPGQTSHNALENARESLANNLGCSADSVVFHSGGTEGILMSLYTLTSAALRLSPTVTIVGTTVDHPAAHGAFRQITQWFPDKINVTLLPVTPDAIKPDDLQAIPSDSTVIVHWQLVHSELGRVFDFSSIIDQLASNNTNILTHIDACQALGKIPKQSFAHRAIDDADLVTYSGHKIGALAGIGVTVINSAKDGMAALIPGSQEWKRRGGTENVLGAIVMAKTAELRLTPASIESQLGQWRSQTELLRNTMAGMPLTMLSPNLPSCIPNTSFVAFDTMSSDKILIALNRRNISVSAGTACRSGLIEPNQTALALGYSQQVALSTIRISLDWGTTATDVDALINALHEIIS